MNVTIKFEEGSDANGCTSGPRPRRKPKPELLFTKDSFRPFKIRSYTCLKCCKRVEVQAGGYLQKIDSNLQNPCAQLLCSDCFQAKTHCRTAVSYREDIHPRHKISQIKTENGTSSETESEITVPKEVLLALGLGKNTEEQSEGAVKIETQTSEHDAVDIKPETISTSLTLIPEEISAMVKDLSAPPLPGN